MKRIITFFILLLSVITLSAKTYHISSNGCSLIKEHEGCHLVSYWDSNGYSIGYGHHGKDVKKNQHICRITAEVYFLKDIRIVEESINKLIDELPYKYNFSQGFIDGFGSMVYNCGENGVRTSHFYQTLKKCRVKNGNMNKGDLKYTIAMVRTTRISAEGHKERRKHEMKVMLK